MIIFFRRLSFVKERKNKNLPELAVLRDSDASWYMREEAGGLILGPYEQGAPACYVDGPDENSEYELFQDDLDRIDDDTIYFIIATLNQLNIDKIRNDILLKVLPLKV